MRGAQCWGIFREREHSPGRETDDAEILRLTGKRLEYLGFEVSLRGPEELDDHGDAPDGIFLMCERAPALRRLRAWESTGRCLVNCPRAVLNTYRERMIAQFEEANVAFIESRLVSTTRSPGALHLPVWVKRPDVHNTQEGDVVFAATDDALQRALSGLAARGIGRAVIQPHLAGDIVKFYGVGTGGGRDGSPPWFRWFYHKDQTIAGYPLDPQRLGRLVRKAAEALGLDVYGGDVIATPSGELVLLDVNAWPSFALYREEASAYIAGYLAQRFGRPQ